MKNRGFALIEVVLWGALIAYSIGAATSVYASYKEGVQADHATAVFADVIDRTLNMREFFNRDFSTTNTPAVIDYSGNRTDKVIGSGTSRKIGTTLGGSISVSPYVVGGVPKGFTASITTVGDECTSVFSNMKNISDYAQSIFIDTVKAWDISTGSDTFINTVRARCALVGVHTLSVNINTNIYTNYRTF